MGLLTEPIIKLNASIVDSAQEFKCFEIIASHPKHVHSKFDFHRCSTHWRTRGTRIIFDRVASESSRWPQVVMTVTNVKSGRLDKHQIGCTAEGDTSEKYRLMGLTMQIN